jgi:hypothetical protein
MCKVDKQSSITKNATFCNITVAGTIFVLVCEGGVKKGGGVSCAGSCHSSIDTRHGAGTA